MPNITFDCVQLTKETKESLIKELTKKSSEITSIPESSFNVLIREEPIENWGIGGVSLAEILKSAKH